MELSSRPVHRAPGSRPVPEGKRHYSEGSRALGFRAFENPLLVILAGIALGYALAWMIEGDGHSEDEGVPGYAKRQRGSRSDES